MAATNVTSVYPWMNGSNVTSDEYPSSEVPVPWLARLLVTSVVSFLIISTNIINIVVIRRTASIPNNAKEYLTSLSVADLMLGLITCCPGVLAVCLDTWPYGAVWCQISGIMHGTSGAVSIWSLSFVSVDRYIALLKPLHYASILTGRRRNLILVSQWLCAVLMFTVPVFTKADFQYYEYSALEGLCGLYWEYAAFCVATGVAIPVTSGTIIVFTTVRILRHLKRAERAVRSTRRGNSDRRATVILVTTATTYFLCWGPYSLEVMLASIDPALTPPPQFHYAALWMANSNSFVNVLIYSAVYRSFRQEVKRLLLTMVTCGRGCPAAKPTKQEGGGHLTTISSTSSLTTLTRASSAQSLSQEKPASIVSTIRL